MLCTIEAAMVKTRILRCVKIEPINVLNIMTVLLERDYVKMAALRSSDTSTCVMPLNTLPVL